MRYRLSSAVLLVAVVLYASVACAAGGLITNDTVVGKGKQAVTGATVQVHYTGWLYDPKPPDKHGAQFDSSVGRGPFGFQLGAGRSARS